MMNFNFKWLKPTKSSAEEVMLGITEMGLQRIAEKHFKRGLSSKEMAFVEGVLREKMEHVEDDENSIFKQAIHEVVELEDAIYEHAIRATELKVRK